MILLFSLACLIIGAAGHDLTWEHPGLDDARPVFLTDLVGDGRMHWCFEAVFAEAGCTTTATSTTTETPSSTSGTSTSKTSTTATTDSATSATETTCFKYEDCYTTCADLTAWHNGDPCADEFCPTCPFAHMCDMTCGICSYITTETHTSTLTSVTQYTTTLSTVSTTTTSVSTTSQSTTSISTGTSITSATATTDSWCYQVNLGEVRFGSTFCDLACRDENCPVNTCATLFCPGCDSGFAGLCDHTCGFCTTQTNTSSTSFTSTTETVSSVTATPTTLTSSSTVTSTTSSMSTFTTTASTISTTRTSITLTTKTSTATGTSSTITTTESITRCPTYSDCIPECAVLVGLDPTKCETLFCPTCDAARTCDTTCEICAENTTSSQTSSMTTSSATSSTTISMTTTASSVTTTVSTRTTVTSATATSESMTITETPCDSVNMMNDTFCNATCQSDLCVQDACQTLFCPDCPGPHAGMCDKTCNFCTTVTVTSSSTASTATTTRTTTSITSFTSTTLSTDTVSTTTITSETTTATNTRTTQTPTTGTTTTKTTDTYTGSVTLTSTATTCPKLDDCLELNVCSFMASECDVTFCPTCSAARMCDTTCGYCHENSTTTMSSTGTSSTTATDSTTTTSLSSTSTTPATDTSTTTSVSTTTISTQTGTETACAPNNTMGDEFCNRTCGAEDCPKDICEILFCPTCQFAGACDSTCGYCTAKLTTTLTSFSATTTATATTASTSSTVTCRPCFIDIPMPYFGCRELLPCGSTCVAIVLNECMEDMEMTFECPAEDGDYNRTEFTPGSAMPPGSYLAAAGRSNVTQMCPQSFPSCQTEGRMKGRCVIKECENAMDSPFTPCTNMPANYPGNFWQEGVNFIMLDNSNTTFCNSDYEEFRGAKLTATTGELDVKCRSCSIGTHELADNNNNCDDIDVTLEFGPNVIDGVVNETMISSYKIYLVSACESPTIGPGLETRYVEVAEVAATPLAGESASDEDCRCGGYRKYSVNVQTTLDKVGGAREYYDDENHTYSYYTSGRAGAVPGYSHADSWFASEWYRGGVELEWRLMVVPVMTDGTVLPVGMTTDVIHDACSITHDFDVDFCFGQEDFLPVCQSTSSTTATTHTGTDTTTLSTNSFTSTSKSTTTTSTESVCFMYQDCWQTCHLMIEEDPAVCGWMFCPTCEHQHQCDTSCGICSYDTTATGTNTNTSETVSSVTATATSGTATTTSATSTSSVSSETTTGTTTTTASSQTECLSVNIMDEYFCNATCNSVNCAPVIDPCSSLYCPACTSPYAGMCDKTCGFCTTQTATSSSSVTSSSVSSSSSTTTGTSRTTTATTTTTMTSVTTSRTTGSLTSTFTGTTTTTISQTTSITSTTTKSTNTDTTCHLYEDCLDTCHGMVFGMVGVSGELLQGTNMQCFNGLCACEEVFCPTCSGAHMCDTTCKICAQNITSTESSTITQSTTSVSSTSLSSTSATSLTTVTTTTTRTTMSVSTSTKSSATSTGTCERINIKGDEFCNASCTGDACRDACETIFCSTCMGAYVGMCDKQCGFCTTVTQTTESSSTRSTTTKTITTSVTSTTTSQSTFSATAVTQTTDTVSDTTTRSTRTTDTTLSVSTDTGTTTSASSTSTETSTCYKFDDCLTTCEEMKDNCAISFCPTCPGAHLCDSTCGICAFNVTHPCLCTTTSETSSMTTASETTTTETSTQTSTQTSESATTVTDTSLTTTTVTTGTTVTSCEPVNLANDTFCNLSCAGNDCPKETCETLFCLTCHFAGYCDRACGFCSFKHTTSRTSVTSITTVSTTTTSTDTTYTCEPCHVNTNLQVGTGVANTCTGPLACGSTCQQQIGYPADSTCVTAQFTVEFECPASDYYYHREQEEFKLWQTGSSWSDGTVLTVDYGLGSDAGRPALIKQVDSGATPLLDVHCTSCGIGAYWATNDTDILCGEITTKLTWGPNVFNGNIDESMITGYAVYAVESCQQSLLESLDAANQLAFVPKSGSNAGTAEQCACSLKEQYEADLTISLPQNTHEQTAGWKLMVVPVQSDGSVVPVGPTVDLEDLCVSTTTETTTTTPNDIDIVSGVLELSLQGGSNVDLSALALAIGALLATRQGVFESQVGVRISDAGSFSELSLTSQVGGSSAITLFICVTAQAVDHLQRLFAMSDSDFKSLVPAGYGTPGVVLPSHVTDVDPSSYQHLSMCDSEFAELQTRYSTVTSTTATRTTVTTATTLTSVTAVTGSTVTSTVTTTPTTFTTKTDTTESGVSYTATGTTLTSATASATSATSTATTISSATITSTTITSTSLTALSLVTGSLTLQLTGVSDPTVVSSAATMAIASVYDVAESLVTVTVTQDRRLSDSPGRRLQASWTVEYEVEANAQHLATKVDAFDPATASARFTQTVATELGVNADTVAVVGFADPTVEATPNPTPSPQRVEPAEGDETSANEAGSSNLVIILGAVAFVVLLVAMLVPFVCRRRLRAALSKNNANLKAADNGEVEVVPEADAPAPAGAESAGGDSKASCRDGISPLREALQAGYASPAGFSDGGHFSNDEPPTGSAPQHWRKWRRPQDGDSAASPSGVEQVEANASALNSLGLTEEEGRRMGIVSAPAGRSTSLDRETPQQLRVPADVQELMLGSV